MRDTKELQIADKKFKVKTYATAQEAHNIQQALFRGTKFEVVGDQPKISELNPAVQFEVQKELIRQMVTEFDGSAETIVERCLELPDEDFQELSSALDALVTKKKK